MHGPVTLEQVIRFLLETPLFEGLGPAELADVVSIMQVQRLRDGQTVFTEGDEGDAWYVVFEGGGIVTKDAGFGPPRVIATLEPRGIFGEMSILDGSRRSASVQARGETTLFKFRREDFDELLGQETVAAFKLVHAMARLLCDRQRRLLSQLAETIEAQSPEQKVNLRERLGGIIDQSSLSD